MSIFTDFAQVTKDLYLSSALALEDESLSKYDIHLVINATVELPLWPASGPPVSAVIRVPLVDSDFQDAYKYFEEVSDLIQQASTNNQNTLIHCVAGVSRSACLCAAYLVRHQNMSRAEALKKLKKVRPLVKPNKGFLEQLSRWEEECRRNKDVSSSHPL